MLNEEQDRKVLAFTDFIICVRAGLRWEDRKQTINKRRKKYQMMIIALQKTKIE